jgi:ribA/ribD-fused uncharacterized protein
MSAIVYMQGADIFTSPCQYLVNPVNCAGVMGKGLALQFKQRFPWIEEPYKRACRNGFQPGQLHILHNGDSGFTRVINFPTKRHWRENSQLEDIEAGLSKLRQAILDRGITSIALPPLGCGLGGLDWEQQVAPLVERYLGDLESVYIEVYAPVPPGAENEPSTGTEPIFFYGTRGPYGCFSNFIGGFVLNNWDWSSVEHYFQAHKFEPSSERFMDIYRAPTAAEARRLGRLKDVPIRKDWNHIKDDVMRLAVTEKFQQNPDMRAVLLSTQGQIIEESPHDYYWGCGANHSGLNKLGHILEDVRDFFQDTANLEEEEQDW